MQQQTSRKITSLLTITAFPFLLLMLLWTHTSIATAGAKTPATFLDEPYSVETVNVTGALEHRFKFHSHHFMTLIDDEGTFNFRPHPGCDINGWGTSWYAQPFQPAPNYSIPTFNPSRLIQPESTLSPPVWCHAARQLPTVTGASP